MHDAIPMHVAQAARHGQRHLLSFVVPGQDAHPVCNLSGSHASLSGRCHQLRARLSPLISQALSSAPVKLVCAVHHILLNCCVEVAALRAVNYSPDLARRPQYLDDDAYPTVGDKKYVRRLITLPEGDSIKGALRV